MANIYVRHLAAGAATGADWANACTSMTAAIVVSSAGGGDDFWVSEDHAESTAGAVTLTFKGTALLPNRVICVNHSGSVPPVSADIAATGSVSTTGVSAITITGFAYIYGVTFNVGSGGTAASSQIASSIASDLIFENCAIKHTTTAGTQVCTLGSVPNTVSSRIRLINTPINFNGGTTGGIRCDGDIVYWQNTPAAIGGTQAALANGFLATARPCVLYFDGLDLTGIASGKNIVGAVTAVCIVRLTNCKLTSGALFATPTVIGASTDIINCDSGATNYRNERYRYQGTLLTETTIVRAFGFSDGTTVVSQKIVTTANSRRQSPFEAFEMLEWIDATGSITRTWEIVNDGVTLTNADAWIEIQYLGSSASPLGSLVSSGPADPLGAGSNIATSTVTWTTTGLASPVKQKIAVTFNPQLKGLYCAVLKVGKASQTLYLDPKPSELP